LDFKQKLAQLNERQRLAVDTTQGPVLLIAGPGSGKTLTLTTRIANILATDDVSPSSILALTFTEQAASHMTDKLKSMIGTDAYKIKMMTFHSFCNEIILENPEKFGLSSNTRNINDLEKIAIIESIIDELDLEFLTSINDPYYYKNEILRLIQNLKRESVNPQELLDMTKKDEAILNSQIQINPRTGKIYDKFAKEQKKISKNYELANIYEAYQQKLVQMEKYDYEDMILMTTEKLEQDPDLLASLQEKYLYILVDEFQDTNGAQTKILELLGNFDDNPNIFVVGDDDQAIYRFQGANVENIFDFVSKYPETNIITLDKTYRCPQKILDAARSLVSHNSSTIEKIIPNLSKDLISNNEKSNKLLVHEFETAEDEIRFVTAEIKKLLDAKVDPKEIAIIYRNHADSVDLLNYLLKNEVPVVSRDKGSMQDNIYVQQFINLLKIIDDYRNDELVYQVLNYKFLNLDRLELFKLSDELKFGKSLFDIIQEKENFKVVLDFVINLHQEQYNLHLVQLLELALKKSNILEYLITNKDYESIEALKSLFNFATQASADNPDYKISNLIEDLAKLTDNKIDLSIDYQDNKEGVQMLTAHKSKGLEFEHVFIFKFQDKKWGNKRKMDKIKLPSMLLDTIKPDHDENEEERRIAYVAITRGINQVHITYAKKAIDKNKETYLQPSQFVSEFDPTTFELIQHESEVVNDTTILEVLEPLDLNASEKAYLKSKVDNFRLSVSALNTYLDSPRAFFESYILKIPQSKTKALILGNIVHKALEISNKAIKNNTNLPDLDYIKKIIDTALKNELLLEKDKESIKKEAEEIITKYLTQLDLNQEIFETEYSYSRLGLTFEDTLLAGKIDLIEWIDRSQKSARIVDYKTGRSKTRNEILGLTKSADKSIFRQLQFYKLLTQLDKNKFFTPVEFEVRFVKPKKNGQFRSEIFSTDEIETESLQEEIRQVIAKIRKFEFD